MAVPCILFLRAFLCAYVLHVHRRGRLPEEFQSPNPCGGSPEIVLAENHQKYKAPKAQHPMPSWMPRHVKYLQHVRHLRPPERKPASSKPECNASRSKWHPHDHKPKKTCNSTTTKSTTTLVSITKSPFGFKVLLRCKEILATWVALVPFAFSAAWATFVPIVTSATCLTSSHWAHFVLLATSAAWATLVPLASPCNFCNTCNFQIALLLQLGLLSYLLQLLQLVLLLQLAVLLYLLQLLQLALLLQLPLATSAAWATFVPVATSA